MGTSLFLLLMLMEFKRSRIGAATKEPSHSGPEAALEPDAEAEREREPEEDPAHQPESPPRSNDELKADLLSTIEPELEKYYMKGR